MLQKCKMVELLGSQHNSAPHLLHLGSLRTLNIIQTYSWLHKMCQQFPDHFTCEQLCFFVFLPFLCIWLKSELTVARYSFQCMSARARFPGFICRNFALFNTILRDSTHSNIKILGIWTRYWDNINMISNFGVYSLYLKLAKTKLRQICCNIVIPKMRGWVCR